MKYIMINDEMDDDWVYDPKHLKDDMTIGEIYFIEQIGDNDFEIKLDNNYKIIINYNNLNHCFELLRDHNFNKLKI